MVPCLSFGLKLVRRPNMYTHEKSSFQDLRYDGCAEVSREDGVISAPHSTVWVSAKPGSFPF